MRSATQALLPFVALVVGFVAGTGFGVVVLSDDGAPEIVLPDGGGSRRGPRAADDEPATEAEDARGGRGRRGVSTDDVLVENSLRGGGGMPATSGDGVVTGTILDPLGKPLADVQISATTDIWSLEEPPEGLAEEAEDSLELRIRRLVWEHRFREATRTTTATGPDGSYRLEGLVSARYYVEPKLTGWRFTAPGNGEWNASPGETRDFVARPVIGVAVAVMMPDGTAPEDALVWYSMSGGGDSTHYTWTPESDPLELGVGHYTFSANAGPQQAYAVDSVGVEISADGSALAELRLVPRPGVIGTIEFSGEARPLTVGLTAIPLSNGGAADEDHLLTAPYSSWAGEPYELALFDLEPGSYLVGAVLRNGVVLGSAIIEIQTEPVEHTFSVGNVDVRDYVVVRPRGPDGSEAVGEVSFVVGYSSGDDISFEGNLAVSPEPDGSYRVPLATPGAPQDNYNGWSSSGEIVPGMDYSGATHYMTVTSTRFGQKRVEYDPRSDHELDVMFSEPAWAVVTVNGYANGPWRGKIEAMLVPSSQGSQMGSTPWLNDDQRRMTPQGVARVGPVEPGSYLVTLMVMTPQNGYRQVAETEVSLGVGETAVTMSVPELHDLTMIVEGNPIDLDLHRDPGPDQTTDFLDEGMMEGQKTIFSALSPGRYRVRHYGEGSTGEMMVDVPSSGSVLFRPVEYNSLRVDTIPDGLESYLQRGDIIVSIGGREMDTERHVRAALALAQTADTVVLSVRRGGRAFEVEVPSAPLEQGYLLYWVR